MKKRLLSGLLCLCMVFALLPTAALAANTPVNKVWVTATEPVAGEKASLEAQMSDESPSSTVVSVGWDGGFNGSSSFQAGESYTIHITLGIKEGVDRIFSTGSIDARINGKTATVESRTDTRLEISYTWSLPAGVTSAPADVTTYQAARALYALGLFNGYDNTGTNFGLDDSLTREQALILLIRLLGEEPAAKAWTGAAPFVDVPEDSFARPYIGYAKEKGYTSGIGKGAFGLGQRADQKNMVVFALRGLGYTDGGAAPDFTYAGCLDKAVELAFIDSNQTIADFNRGDAVDILFGALGATVKGGNQDLLTKLQTGGVLTQEQINKAAAILEDPAEREAPAKPAESAKPAETEKPAEQAKPVSTGTTEDPLPPEDYAKSPAWYISLKRPENKTNANLVGDYEALEQWKAKMNGKYTEPVLVRAEELGSELFGRVGALDKYASYMIEAEDMRKQGNDHWEQSYTSQAEHWKNTDFGKNAMASDLAPLKPYLDDKTIEFFGL